MSNILLQDGSLLIAVIAGVITMLATGIGAIVVLMKSSLPQWMVPAGSALAGGMMVSVTVFDLLVTGVNRGSPWEAGAGFLMGCAFLWALSRLPQLASRQPPVC